MFQYHLKASIHEKMGKTTINDSLQAPKIPKIALKKKFSKFYSICICADEVFTSEEVAILQFLL